MSASKNVLRDTVRPPTSPEYAVWARELWFIHWSGVRSDGRPAGTGSLQGDRKDEQDSNRGTRPGRLINHANEVVARFTLTGGGLCGSFGINNPDI
jgi:hypothetical protein